MLAALLKPMVDEGTKEGVDVNEVVQDMDWSEYEMEKLFTPDREDDDDRRGAVAEQPSKAARRATHGDISIRYEPEMLLLVNSKNLDSA